LKRIGSVKLAQLTPGTVEDFRDRLQLELSSALARMPRAMDGSGPAGKGVVLMPDREQVSLAVSPKIKVELAGRVSRGVTYHEIARDDKIIG
jgi:hypothetical protein